MKKIIFYDEIEDLYTITLQGKGGPIISNKDLNIANQKFDEAFELADVVRKVLLLRQ